MGIAKRKKTPHTLTMKLTAGIDLGTQSLKVVLYDYENKKIAAQTSCALDLICDEDGTREQKTQWYDQALKKCFNDIPSSLRSAICALGVSGQQHGFVALDKNGKSLYNVKLWNDTSTAEECRLITESCGSQDKVIALCGNLMLPGFTAPKILWLKRHKSEAWKKLQYIMLPHDYINYVLTGNYVMEYGDASGTALLDPVQRKWSKKMCSVIDENLLALLPPLIEADSCAGHVSHKAAAEFGLPEGIPVASGGGDNMMGAVGTGCVNDGFLTMSLGTSGTLYGYSDKSIADPKNGISGFCSSTGGWLPLLCTMNCTVATERIRSLFALEVKEFDKLASQAPAGSAGVIVLPFFNGERTPNLPNGKASISGLTAANAQRENICRAAMESAVFAMKGGLNAFKAMGFKPKEIRLIGGGAKSPLWRRIAADVLNVPIKIPVQTEAAALGAAIQALWCLKGGTQAQLKKLCADHVMLHEAEAVVPDKKNVQAYERSYAAYCELLQTVVPLYV